MWLIVDGRKKEVSERWAAKWLVSGEGKWEDFLNQSSSHRNTRSACFNNDDDPRLTTADSLRVLLFSKMISLLPRPIAPISGLFYREKF
jgi:hypothetical protein